ncbi:hypothetical protein Pan258_37970 [Symmachiella dynata]|uniref:hypothetical protein n=1 Tax=Symmachiella dynata TaxID=2527995 RepID=UPI0011878735|nr:hypothetical protein [Symmachiella dynata]QDT49742.1 hypothetical protein Pan258_37970 [Symmachiella dynata]
MTKIFTAAVGFVILLSALFAASARAADEPASLRMTIVVNLGEDLGQNYGSLFEIKNRDGKVVGGAGFEGVYNTTGRGNRRRLQLFVKTPGQPLEYDVKSLPRSTTDAGVYLADFNGRLQAQSASGGKDRRLMAWDGSRWVPDEKHVPFATYVADKVMEVVSPRVLYGGQPILDLTGKDVGIARYYYAGGHLFVRVHGKGVNEIAACPWRPSQSAEIDYKAAPKIPMRMPYEFIYSYGQLGDDVLAATNTGGVYRFNGQEWKCLVEPIADVSYQVYTMITYYDRLLLGQYPTGNLFEYDGQEVRHLQDQPPVMPGVSNAAREAQTTAIYGGDLYVGVWPWAELWRLDSNSHKWQFSRRMFTHPPLTDAQVHPYEKEATQLGHVLNRWGHRITGLIPLGDSLFVSTSSKGSTPYDPSYGFLNEDDKWKEYGRVYQLTLPGQVSLDTEWKAGPITFEITATPDQLTLRQAGGKSQVARITRAMFDALRSGQVIQRSGVFGKFGGQELTVTKNVTE